MYARVNQVLLFLLVMYFNTQFYFGLTKDTPYVCNSENCTGPYLDDDTRTVMPGLTWTKDSLDFQMDPFYTSNSVVITSTAGHDCVINTSNKFPSWESSDCTTARNFLCQFDCQGN